MLTDIRLQHFRSYKDSTFEFSDGVNIIVGPNASGKTNLLEALLVVASGKSYRVKDQELIQHGKPWARIDARTDSGVRTIKLRAELEPGINKEIIINEALIKKLSIQKQMPVVLFEPEHLQLLNGSPELRRDYLDDLIEQFTPGYENIRRNYKRALRQRNTLLKQNKPSDQIFVWNLRLSDLGDQLIKNRLQLLNRLNSDLGAMYKSMGGHTTDVNIHYESTCNTEQYSSSLLKKLEASLETDQRRGFTTHGPHRDDFSVILKSHQADITASRGEVRTILLALKTLQLKLLEEDRGQKPLLLLDDVFSELDGSRRKALTETIKGYQTFITTTDADVVVQHFTETCHIIPLQKAI